MKLKYDIRSTQSQCSLAEAHGYKCVFPRADEIFVDIDGEDQLKDFRQRLSMVRVWVDGVKASWKPSKSGKPHYHAKVKWPHLLTELERIALSAILGSDPKYAAMAFLAYKQDEQNRMLFFEVGSE